MEEKHAAFESAHSESNGVAHNSDHGWQKVTYAKKQKKKTNNNDSRANSNKLVPNGTLSGGDSVFRSLELQSEDRRRRILEAQREADAGFDDAPVRSKQRSRDNDEDEDDEDVERSAENGKAEEAKKVKQKKPKQPKVTLAEAAAKIDAADLEAFLADISVGLLILVDFDLNHTCLGLICWIK